MLNYANEEDDMDKAAPAEPAPLEGLHFTVEDLQMALNWVAKRPRMRLAVAIDHRFVPEALEICPPDAKSPRWCIWRDYEGNMHLDDWLRSEFDLPYHTLPAALAFIERNL
jgi:hypothetical protein